jgi:hypothetical protein
MVGCGAFRNISAAALSLRSLVANAPFANYLVGGNVFRRCTGGGAEPEALIDQLETLANTGVDLRVELMALGVIHSRLKGYLQTIDLLTNGREVFF